MGLWLDRGRECDNLHQAIEIQIIQYLCGTDSPVSVALNTPLDRPIDRALRGFFIRFCYPSVTRPPKWRLLVTNKPIYHSELQPILERSNRFCIEKEAEIYCTSAKVALKSQEKSIGPQIADMANNLIVNGVVDFPYSTILQFMVTWTEQAVRANGWNIQDEDGVSWWIGLYAQSYIRAMNNNEHSFDEIFKAVFVKYFELR